MINSLAPLPPPQEELRNCALRIRPLVSAERTWRDLTPQERERLGGNLESAYKRWGTAGMWVQLRGVTPKRAVVDVAKKLGFVRVDDYEWLLREINEILDVEEAISRAIASGDFVLVERPRAAHWNGEEIQIDWKSQSAMWEFLWELGRSSKAERPIDAFTFGEGKSCDIVTKRKSRLSNMKGFPIDLIDRIESVGLGSQQLMLPRERIRIFGLTGVDSLDEWLP